MRGNAGVLVCSLALLACQREFSSFADAGPNDPEAGPDGPGGEGDEGDGADEDEDDGDHGDDGDEWAGDDPGSGGSSDPDDEPPRCDLSELDEVDPLWLVEVESPIPDAAGMIVALAVVRTEPGAEPGAELGPEGEPDAIFAVGVHDISDSAPPGFVERRTLAGELVWSAELPEVRNAKLRWDGEHVYVAHGSAVRRWSSDGVLDDWQIHAEFIGDLWVGDDAVAVIGDHTNQGGHADHTDGFYQAKTKTSPPALIAAGEFGILDRSERGQAIGPAPWGGWIAAGSIADQGGNQGVGHTWLVGFGAPAHASAYELIGPSTIVALAEFGPTLTVVGRHSKQGPKQGQVWTAAMMTPGELGEHHDYWLCGTAPSSVRAVTAGDGAIWALGSVILSADHTATVLVEFDPEGRLREVRVIPIDPANAYLPALARTDAGLYVGGFITVDDRYLRVIGSLEW